MKENIKEIMRLSFHDNFFIDRSSPNSNFEYLDQLVDLVLKKEDSEDYENIANAVWQYDKRIKKIFSPNMEILPLCVSDFNIDKSIVDCCVDEIAQDDIKKIVRCSNGEADFRHKYKFSIMLHNMKLVNSHLNKNITDSILFNLKKIFGITLENIKIYKVKKFSSDDKLNIALNELIYILAEYLGYRFSYQTLDAISLLETFEKTEMYYQIYEGLSARKINGLSELQELNPVIKNVFKPIAPTYECDEYEFIFAEVDENERVMADACMFMQNKFYEVVFKLLKDKNELDREIVKLKASIERKQCEIELLRKNLTQSQHQLEEINLDKEREKEKLESREGAMRKEVFSLREYLFSKERDEEENEIIHHKQQLCKTNYSDVVIVGGHKRWQNKVVDELKGVTVLSTDQNIIDWSFLNNKKVVVVVTNYISHSMYLRLISKIEEQELLYIDFKNVEKLKKKLDELDVIE